MVTCTDCRVILRWMHEHENTKGTSTSKVLDIIVDLIV